MKRATTVLVAALALLGAATAGLTIAACGGESVPSDAVATVGDVTVTKADFEGLLTQAQVQMKAQGMDVPKEGTAAYDHYVAQVVSYLVQEQVIEQSAEELGVSVTEKEVGAQVAELAKAYGGEQKIVGLLKEQGMTMELLKRSIRSQTLSERAAEIVTKGASVSDAQIRMYWEAHKAELRKEKTTATLAKARATIEQTLLSAAKLQLWNAWVAERAKALGVEYASGYDPALLTPQASASPTG
jgi:hypothetical protein